MNFDFNQLKGQNLSVHLIENYGVIPNPHFDQDNQILMSEIGYIYGVLIEVYNDFIMMEVKKTNEESTKKVLIAKNFIKMIEID